MRTIVNNALCSLAYSVCNADRAVNIAEQICSNIA